MNNNECLTAEHMFKELGYEKITRKCGSFKYTNGQITVSFYKAGYDISSRDIIVGVSKNLHKAINQQMKELGK